MRTLLEITRLGDFTVKAHKPAGLSTIGIHKSGVIAISHQLDLTSIWTI